MSQSRCLVTVFLVACFSFVSVHAAGTDSSAFLDSRGYSLPEAVEDALAYDRRIESASLQVALSKEQLTEAKGASFPVISGVGYGGRLYSDNDLNASGSPQRSGNRYNYGLEIDQPIYTFGRNKAGRAVAVANVSHAEARLAETNYLVLQETALSFISLTVARRVLDLVLEGEREMLGLLDTTEKRKTLALGTRTEVALVQSRYLQVTARRISAEATYQAQSDDLARLTGKTVTDLDLASAGHYHALLPADLQQALDIGLSNHYRLRTAQANVERQESELALARSQLRPELRISAQYLQGKVPRDFDIDNQILGLNFNLPIYTGGQVRSRIRQSRYALEGAREDLSYEHQFLETEIRKAWTYYHGTREALFAWEEAAAAERGALAGIEQEVDERIRSLAYLLESKEQALEVYIQTAVTEGEYHRASVTLWELINDR